MPTPESKPEATSRDIASPTTRLPWYRPEPFGAWVRLDDATLVAVNASLAARLGVPAQEPLAGPTRPLELHVAVTARCPAPCTGCYLDPSPDGREPPFEDLADRLAQARALGVSMVAFGGGEPMTRRDLGRLADEARRLGLVPVVTTSGIGLTKDRAHELKSFAQINVSHDGVGESYAAVRGYDGRAVAERALGVLAEAGIPAGVNLVLTRSSLPHMAATAARVRELGARELQLLRYKPAGRAASSEYASRCLTPDEVSGLWPAIVRVIEARLLAVRIDCAMVPLLSEALIANVADPAKALAALGVFGCEAGRHLGALRVDGTAAACSFFSLAPPDVVPLAPKERVAATLDAAWRRDGSMIRLRAYHASLPEPCVSCPLSAVCRGGCQIVNRALRSTFGPDPECLRVQRSRGERERMPSP